MYKYRIKIYMDDTGRYRFLPQHKWLFFWLSFHIIYSTYEEAHRALSDYKKEVEDKPVYKYIKEEDL